jgi:hypothetical protein
MPTCWPACRASDHAVLLLGLLAHGDHVTGLDQVRRDVDRLAVHRDRLVRHQLARFGAGGAEAHAVDDVVQTRLQQEQQVGAGVALAAVGFSEVAAELRSSTPYMRLTFCFSRSCRPKSEVR